MDCGKAPEESRGGGSGLVRDGKRRAAKGEEGGAGRWIEMRAEALEGGGSAGGRHFLNLQDTLPITGFSILSISMYDMIDITVSFINFIVY